MEENLAAMRLELSKEELQAVRDLAEASGAAKGGARAPPGMSEASFIDTVPL